MILQKIRAILAVLIVYVAAIFIAFRIFMLLPMDNTSIYVVVKFFIADVVATILVYLVGLIFKNPSFYDPYWSVIPLVIVIGYAAVLNCFNTFSIVMISLIGLWSFRLTFNWAYCFRNITDVDWRYTMFKERYPKVFQLINFFGIHMFPTVVVFIGMLPVFGYMDLISKGYAPSIMFVIAVVVTFGAVIIELLSDAQMKIFKHYPSNDGLVCTNGLWKNSRHPNYFGECMFWFGLMLMYMSIEQANVLLVIAPLPIFLMFEFISIPMIDKRQLERKPAYKEYKDQTNPMLIIFPPKKK